MPRIDREGVLEWLDGSLKRAHDEGRVRAGRLLEAVKAEILFEIEFARGALPARRLAERRDGSGS